MNTPAIPHDALRITFFQVSAVHQMRAGWLHEKTVPYCIIAQPLRGEYEIGYDGRSVRVKPPGAFVAPPNVPLHIVHHGDRKKQFAARWIHFSCTLFHGIDLADLLILPRQIEGTTARALDHLMTELAAPTHNLATISARHELAWKTVRMICEISSPRPETEGLLQAGERLHPLLGWMRENLTSPITVEDMARVAGMSQSRLHTFFRERLRRSPQSWLKYLRLDVAAALLISTDAPLKEIAARSGFANAFHISREFKRRFGSSPKEFRRLHVWTA